MRNICSTQEDPVQLHGQEELADSAIQNHVFRDCRTKNRRTALRPCLAPCSSQANLESPSRIGEGLQHCRPLLRSAANETQYRTNFTN